MYDQLIVSFVSEIDIVHFGNVIEQDRKNSKADKDLEANATESGNLTNKTSPINVTNISESHVPRSNCNRYFDDII